MCNHHEYKNRTRPFRYAYPLMYICECGWLRATIFYSTSVTCCPRFWRPNGSSPHHISHKEPATTSQCLSGLLVMSVCPVCLPLAHMISLYILYIPASWSFLVYFTSFSDDPLLSIPTWSVFRQSACSMSAPESIEWFIEGQTISPWYYLAPTPPPPPSTVSIFDFRHTGRLSLRLRDNFLTR